MTRKLFFFVLITLLAIMISSCGSNVPASLHGQFGFEIDPVFEPLVNALGDLRSDPITDGFLRNGITYQYTLGYLMVYNPAAPMGQQYKIYPLGRDLKIQLPTVNNPSPDELIVDGYVIWDELVEIYKMYGTSLIGPPTTPQLYNLVERRYEQYFTNMAFYREIDLPNEGVKLMPYGAWYCGVVCEEAHTYISPHFYPLPPDGRILADEPVKIENSFNAFELKLGSDLTGSALGEIYTNLQGQHVRIYENVVMYIDPTFLNQVELMDLPAEVSVISDELEPPSENPDLIFYPILKKLGFNILRDFYDYIMRHMGMEASGPPIKRLYKLDNNNLAQCFEHYCLEYEPSALPSSRVKVMPLGRTFYENLTGVSPIVDYQIEEEVPGALTIRIWEDHPLLPSGESQVIGVAAFSEKIDKPVAGVNFYVTLLLPDGSQMINFLQPTNQEGLTQIVLDPLKFPKGTMIPYQVCIAGYTEGIACLSETFLVWDSN